jgi:hypothetical protein
MKILDGSKKIFTLCRDLFVQSIWKLKIINNSPLDLSTMLKIFIYLFSVLFVANFLYIVFVKRKIVKGGKKNFRIFPTVIIVPLAVIVIFEVFNILVIFISENKLRENKEVEEKIEKQIEDLEYITELKEM